MKCFTDNINMFALLLPLLVAIELVICTPLPQEDAEAEREGRAFIGFSFFAPPARVEPHQCVATNGLLTIGTCYNTQSCTEAGGVDSGTCPTGGICCVIPSVCGGTIARNLTWFVNKDFPERTRDAGDCIVTIKKEFPRVKQARLDFQSLQLEGPYQGRCSKDAFVVSKVHNVNGRNKEEEIVPKLCGDNSNQHVYVDMEQDEVQIKVKLDSGSLSRGASPGREWRVLVTQLDDKDIAPPKCLQYHKDGSAEVRSLNYGATDEFRDDLNYDICFSKLSRDEQAEESCTRKFTNVNIDQTKSYREQNRVRRRKMKKNKNNRSGRSVESRELPARSPPAQSLPSNKVSDAFSDVISLVSRTVAKVKNETDLKKSEDDVQNSISTTTQQMTEATSMYTSEENSDTTTVKYESNSQTISDSLKKNHNFAVDAPDVFPMFYSAGDEEVISQIQRVVLQLQQEQLGITGLGISQGEFGGFDSQTDSKLLQDTTRDFHSSEVTETSEIPGYSPVTNPAEIGVNLYDADDTDKEDQNNNLDEDSKGIEDSVSTISNILSDLLNEYSATTVDVPGYSLVTNSAEIGVNVNADDTDKEDQNTNLDEDSKGIEDSVSTISNILSDLLNEYSATTVDVPEEVADNIALEGSLSATLMAPETSKEADMELKIGMADTLLEPVTTILAVEGPVTEAVLSLEGIKVPSIEEETDKAEIALDTVIDNLPTESVSPEGIEVTNMKVESDGTAMLSTNESGKDDSNASKESDMELKISMADTLSEPVTTILAVEGPVTEAVLSLEGIKVPSIEEETDKAEIARDTVIDNSTTESVTPEGIEVTNIKVESDETAMFSTNESGKDDSNALKQDSAPEIQEAVAALPHSDLDLNDQFLVTETYDNLDNVTTIPSEINTAPASDTLADSVGIEGESDSAHVEITVLDPEFVQVHGDLIIKNQLNDYYTSTTKSLIDDTDDAIVNIDVTPSTTEADYAAATIYGISDLKEPISNDESVASPSEKDNEDIAPAKISGDNSENSEKQSDNEIEWLILEGDSTGNTDTQELSLAIPPEVVISSDIGFGFNSSIKNEEVSNSEKDNSEIPEDNATGTNDRNVNDSFEDSNLNSMQDATNSDEGPSDATVSTNKPVNLYQTQPQESDVSHEENTQAYNGNAEDLFSLGVIPENQMDTNFETYESMNNEVENTPSEAPVEDFIIPEENQDYLWTNEDSIGNKDSSGEMLDPSASAGMSDTEEMADSNRVTGGDIFESDSSSEIHMNENDNFAGNSSVMDNDFMTQGNESPESDMTDFTSSSDITNTGGVAESDQTEDTSTIDEAIIDISEDDNEATSNANIDITIHATSFDSVGNGDYTDHIEDDSDSITEEEPIFLPEVVFPSDEEQCGGSFLKVQQNIICGAELRQETLEGVSDEDERFRDVERISVRSMENARQSLRFELRYETQCPESKDDPTPKPPVRKTVTLLQYLLGWYR